MLPIGGKKENFNSKLNDQTANEEPLRRSSRINKKMLAQNIDKSRNDISKNTKELTNLENAEELEKNLIESPKLELSKLKGINGGINDEGISKKSNTTRKKCLVKAKSQENAQLIQEFYSGNCQQNHEVNNSKHIDHSPSIDVDQVAVEVTAHSNGQENMKKGLETLYILNEQQSPVEKSRSKKDKLNSQKNQSRKTHNKRTNMSKTNKKEQDEGQSGIPTVEKCVNADVVLPSTTNLSTMGLRYNNKDKNRKIEVKESHRKKSKKTISESNFDITVNTHNQKEAEISEDTSVLKETLQSRTKINLKKKESIKKSEEPKSSEIKREKNSRSRASGVENEKETSSPTTTFKKKASSNKLETLKDKFGELKIQPILDKLPKEKKDKLNSQQDTQQYAINLRDIHLLRDSPGTIRAKNYFSPRNKEKVVNIDSKLVSSSRMRNCRCDDEVGFSSDSSTTSNQYSCLGDNIEDYLDPSTYGLRKLDHLRSSIETYNYSVTCTICYEQFFFKKQVENHLRIHNILSCCCPACVKEMDNFQRMSC